MADFTELVDLAAERLGGTVLWATDDFFASKDNLLKLAEPVFLPGEYTDRGKWMDGWESRRKRQYAMVAGGNAGPRPTPAEEDYCLVRLGLPGIVRGVVVDTAHFTGNTVTFVDVGVVGDPGKFRVIECVFEHHGVAIDTANRNGVAVGIDRKLIGFFGIAFQAINIAIPHGAGFQIIF